MPILSYAPEVIGEVPGDMFENVQASCRDYFGNYHPDVINIGGRISHLNYEFHDALLPLINLVVERESTRIVRLGTTVNFGELSEVPVRPTDNWHKDDWRLSRTARYVVAESLGTEFKIPAWCNQGIVDDEPPLTPGLEVAGKKRLHHIVRPRPLTVVRFKRHKHRAPLDPTRSIGRRPWIRMGVYDYVD